MVIYQISGAKVQRGYDEHGYLSHLSNFAATVGTTRNANPHFAAPRHLFTAPSKIPQRTYLQGFGSQAASGKRGETDRAEVARQRERHGPSMLHKDYNTLAREQHPIKPGEYLMPTDVTHIIRK
ncbi:hypothetical protein J6590_009181 [Homalodisca vitripennis]|nr:hypothetical protein J6590_009181 [Homalodisca vitripennis]